MKKIIIPIIVSGLLLFSCMDNKNTEQDSFFYYQEWYKLVTLQNDMVLDPFNIAYRLNIYLNETDPNLQNSLLDGMKITTEGTKYILDFSLVNKEYDLQRYGQVTIETNGEDFNSEGAVWVITTDDDYPYIVQKESYGWVEQKITNGRFTITNTGDKSWNIEANRIYLRFIDEDLFSEWDLRLNITQTSGNLTYESLALGVEFQMQTDENFISGGKNVYNMVFRYYITSPVLYSSKCPHLTKAGGSEMLIRMDDYNMIGQDTLLYDMGNTLTCLPQYKITLIKDGIEYSEIVE
ncbi:MAG: hypothetical protein LIO79_09150 [Rikenellaceae bacterium]|nr:hypothetical protein [Rikenellaceae bacterium]